MGLLVGWIAALSVFVWRFFDAAYKVSLVLAIVLTGEGCLLLALSAAIAWLGRTAYRRWAPLRLTLACQRIQSCLVCDCAVRAASHCCVAPTASYGSGSSAMEAVDTAGAEATHGKHRHHVRQAGKIRDAVAMVAWTVVVACVLGAWLTAGPGDTTVGLQSVSSPSAPAVDGLEAGAAAPLVATHGQGPTSGGPAGGQRYFIAANLFENEAILPHWSQELLRLIEVLGRGNVFVSIFENGSRDATAALLEALAGDLAARGIAHNIVADAKSTKPQPTVMQGYSVVYEPSDPAHDRIGFLSGVRNKALAPLWWPLERQRSQFFTTDMSQSAPPMTNRGTAAPPPTANYTHVIFLNDVVYRAVDVLQLLQWPGTRRNPGAGTAGAGLRGPGAGSSSDMEASSSRVGDFDVACALDFDGQGLYDRWVIRDAEGRTVSLYPPHFRSTAAQEQYRARALMPMYSCWNGIAILVREKQQSLYVVCWFDMCMCSSLCIDCLQNAEPFLKHGVVFRRNHYKEDECYGSECFFVCHDFRALGYNRIHLDPAVVVTYRWSHDWLYRNVMQQPLMTWLLARMYTLEDDPLVGKDSIFKHYDNGVQCIVWP